MILNRIGGIRITTLLCNEQRYSVDIPRTHYWTNNKSVIFIICFENNTDKRSFIKNCRIYKEFKIDFEIYHNCKVNSIPFTNMVKCFASDKTFEEIDAFDFFYGKISI